MIVTYRTYIKNDYKPVDTGYPGERRRRGFRIGAFGLLMSLGFGFAMISLPESASQGSAAAVNLPALTPASPREEGGLFVPAPTPDITAATNPALTSVAVSSGDSLARIFSRLDYSPQILDSMLSSGEAAQRLRHLVPGHVLQFVEDSEREPVELRMELSHTEVLEITRTDTGYRSDLIVSQLEPRVRRTEGRIVSSLFLAGQEAGLSDNLIMQLAAIFGWDIDFVLEVREGDEFRVLYEELYRGDKKVSDGAILAAEFRNRGHAYRAVRFADAEGRADYYSDSGASMRKAFLRTPLNFTRISSAFDLRRKHPILNRIRAHRGVDYAAPTGTPVKAAGDGTVAYVGPKGGYGRVVMLRHAGMYNTLYAHLSRYATGMKAGTRVTQGQVIGYVGMSGLATGPHLHYEFQVSGVHRNPLTVPLPNAQGIRADDRARFDSHSAPLLARLDGEATPAGEMLALDEISADPPAIH